MNPGHWISGLWVGGASQEAAVPEDQRPHQAAGEEVAADFLARRWQVVALPGGAGGHSQEDSHTYLRDRCALRRIVKDSPLWCLGALP